MFKLKSFHYFKLAKFNLFLFFFQNHQIVHKDLRPVNIMLESYGTKPNFKLVDFGLSRKFSPEKRMKSTCQNLHYRAPEVFMGASYTEKIDTWSLGITFGEVLLKGEMPFGNKESEDIKLDRQIVST